MGKKLLILLLPLLISCAEKVDLIVYNAEVFTSNDKSPLATSFAVKDGQFIYVGDDSVISEYSSSNIINAEGLPVYPGFIDSHAHFYNLGFSNAQLDLKGTKSFEEIVEKVIEFDKVNNKKFIIGRGWDQNDWDVSSLPVNNLLNQEFPDKAVILGRIDGHAYLVNDYALDLAGINNSSEIEGG